MKVLNNVKRNKIISFLLFCLLAFCLVAGNMGISDTLAKTVQIENEGGSTSGTGINVSKLISATDIENIFDITLSIETETEVSKMYENPPMSVVVVMDISNSMFTRNSSTGIIPYDDAMEAMKDFINKYSEEAKETIVPRELAVVTFNTDAHVQQSLVDCSGSVNANAIYNNVYDGISDVIDVPGEYGDHDSRYTNMEAGLRMAENILDGAKTENKFIILISDGLPTTYSKNSENDDTEYIEGYPPFSDYGAIGTDGVFYSELANQYCDSGTSYSDTAAIKAHNRAKKIKDKDISIYCMGVNIGGQLVEDLQKFVVESNTGYSNSTDIYKALAINNSAVKGTYDHPYKDWLYNEIGTKYYEDGNTYSEMSAVYNEIYETIKANGKKIVIDSWKASDPMNQLEGTKNIEFLKFYNKSGELTASNQLEGLSELNAENTVSFDTSLETITWNIPVSGYTTKVVDGDTIYCYSLKYRVRLKNESNGFVSNTAVPTNGRTILNYLINSNGTMTEKTIEFKVPEVEGYLGSFSFIKVDEDNKQPLKGVEFKLTHKADECSICEAMGKVVAIEDMTAVSDENGKVEFSSIPSGHEYMLKETATITGYIINDTEYNVSVEAGEVKIDGKAVFETIGNMPKAYKLTYVVVTPEADCPSDDKTDATPDVVTGILYGRDVMIEDALNTEAQTDREGRPGEWVFSGWYENSSCTGSAIDKINIKEDEIVYGKWEFIPDKYKVEYVLSGDPVYGIPMDNDANIAPTDTNEYIYGDTAIVKPQKNTSWTTVDGTGNTAPGTWYFIGWFDNKNYTGTVLDEKVIYHDEILYGKWEFIPDTYILDYVIVTPFEDCPDADTSAETSQIPDSVENIKWNTDVTLETGLTTQSVSKDGVIGLWVFSGWYEDAACSGESIDAINIKQDETVYGKWEFVPGKVNLKYEVEGDPVHGIPTDSVTPVDDTIYNINDMAQVKDKLVTNDDTNVNGVPGEWIFDGWYYDDEYTNDVDTGSVVMDEHKTLFGRWSFVPNTYTLDYVIVDTGFGKPDEGKTDDVPDMVTDIPYDTDKILAGAVNTTDTVKDGVPGEWIFAGWYDNEECSGTPIDEINIKQNETVYGTWEFVPEKYSVEYVVEGDPVHGLPTDSITPVDNNVYISGDTVLIKDTLTTIDEVNSDNVPGEWTFDGWFYDDAYTQSVDTDSIVIVEDEIFYGKWTFVPETYTLNYIIVDTGYGIPQVELTDKTPATVYEIPYDVDKQLANVLDTTDKVKDGVSGVWVFKGWFKNSDCSGNSIKNINIKQDETVYGTWEFIPNKIDVEYIVEGDPVYGLPSDSYVPNDTNVYDVGDTVVIKDVLTTVDTEDLNGTPGKWTFDGWYFDEEYTQPVEDDEVVITEHEIFYGKWKFVPDTYTLDYIIVDTGYGVPDADLTDATPEIITGIPYNTNKTLVKQLSTSDNKGGVWVFKGWYEYSDCTGTTIKDINIRKNETVYGTWEFMPDKINVEYVVAGDPEYGLPSDSYVPKDTNVYDAGDSVIVKDVLTTVDTEDSKGISGKWTFDGWYFDDKYTQPVDDKVVITEHEIFYGKWNFVPDTYYTLDYVIVDTGSGLPDSELTDATPDKVTGIPYDTDKTLAGQLSTRDGKDGVWVFKGWYKSSDCTGTTITDINIRKNETVYGTWEFIQDKYKVEYEITGDIIYGVPTDVVVPSVEIFDYEDLVKIKDNLVTSWITSDGTPDGIPGTWEFVIWDRDDFIITEDTTIYGKWVFTPKVYTLKYVIVSKENPSDMIIPSMVTGIEYDTDKVLADRLVTALDEKDGVEGVWKFKGWYENEDCTGNPIDMKNIKQDEIVYGLWEFVPNGMVNVGDKAPVAAVIALILVSLTGMGIVIRKR